MILNGCSLSSGVPHLLSYKRNACSFRSAVSNIPHSQKTVVSFYGRSEPHVQIKSPALLGISVILSIELNSRFSDCCLTFSYFEFMWLYCIILVFVALHFAKTSV